MESDPVAAFARETLGGHADPGPVSLIAARSGAELYAGARLVLKVHRPGTPVADLRRRLVAATRYDALLTPVVADVLRAPDARPATLWPRVEVLSPSVQAPWAEAATMLAGLHRSSDVPEGLPAADTGARLRRALARLPTGERLVRGLLERLVANPPDGTAGVTTVVHGDWHLGQLGRTEGASLVLLDVDDLGVGDPAWDLARPAGFWAAGLLPDEDWSAFLGAYRRAGGPALPPDGDPWRALEVPARAAVAVAASRLLGPPDGSPHRDPEALEALMAACARIDAMERSGA